MFILCGAMQILKNRTNQPKNCGWTDLYGLIFMLLLTTDPSFSVENSLANFCFFKDVCVCEINCLGREGSSGRIRSFDICFWEWMHLCGGRKMWTLRAYSEIYLWPFLCLSQKCQVRKPAEPAEFCTRLYFSLIFLTEVSVWGSSMLKPLKKQTVEM